ncbi:MAG: hypothetical protein IMY72_07550 [Bacteroidetes bacterium]|nr:hypothetical protein [Bacteroidota bacterium]
MDNKDAIKNINKDIKEIEIIVKSVDNNSEIHQIDIDIILSKIRNLYDKVLMFNNIKKVVQKNLSINDRAEEQQIIIKSKTEAQEKIKIEKSIEEKEQEEIKKIIVKRTKEITDDNMEDITLQPHKINRAILEKTDIKSEEIKVDNLTEREVISENNEAQVNNIIADSFTISQKSINEKIAEKNKTKDLATKLKDKPVSDINKIVSLNEKIQFIQILFNGNSQLYKKTIDAVNAFGNIEKVIEFFNQNFNWDKKNKHYISFLELINRRFL